MVSLLKSLLGKNFRFIIVNGELANLAGVPFRACRENFHIKFKQYSTMKTEEQSDMDSEICISHLRKMISDFDKKYSSIILNRSISTVETNGYVDPFTGAIIINSKTYDLVSDPSLHDGKNQYTTEQEKLLGEFRINHIKNYMKIFNYTINRRLTSQYMPVTVKGHLIGGLFQPTMVQSPNIISPMTYGLNSWVRAIFASDEVHLSMEGTSKTKLTLSCVSMYDISKKMGMDTIIGLDRKRFMFMLLATLLSQTDKKELEEFCNDNSFLFNSIIGISEQKELLARMLQYAAKYRTAVAVR